MLPTPTQQLEVVRHLVEQARTADEAGADVDTLLHDAARLLRRLERSWPRRMPFLVDDNERAIVVLQTLAPMVSALAPEIVAAAARPAATSEDAAHELNLELQTLLATAVSELPDSADGDRGRTSIAGHLRHRLAADPGLNRKPRPRP